MSQVLFGNHVKVALKWHKLLFLFFFLIGGNITRAQVSTYYTFYQYNETYNPGISTTSTTPADVFSEFWDDDVTVYPIPFNFTYNGVLYTTAGSIGVDSDAWIAFSNSNPITMTGNLGGGSWVSITDHTGVYLNGTGNNNGFAGFNGDLNEQEFDDITVSATNGSNILSGISSFANIKIGTRLSGTGIPDGTVVNAFTATTITMSAAATASGSLTVTPRSSIYAFIRGVAPYRQFVVQWTDAKRFDGLGNDNFNFQLVINEGGGLPAAQTIQAVYGTCISNSTEDLKLQVGLRGASTADFNARRSNANWSATSPNATNLQGITLNDLVFPPNTLVFNWSPQCVLTPSPAGAISGSTTICPNTTVVYSLTGVPNANYYTWTYSGTGATFSATTTLPTVPVTFGAAPTGGTLTVTPHNQCGTGTPSSLAISVAVAGSATISYPLATYCKSTAGTISVTQTGTPGGTYTASPAGLTINAAGTITPGSSTPGTYIVSYSFTNGVCSGIATATVSIVANPVVAASAGSPLICAGGNSQLTASVTNAAYAVNSIAYSSLTPSGAPTNVFNVYTDEAISAAFAIPFTFTYFGQPVTQFYVSSNGYIQLQSGAVNSLTPQTLPDPTTPNNVIALSWSDLVVDPSTHAGANIRYFVNGIAPSRILVIEFTNLCFFAITNSGTVTGQIRLYESDNHIEIAAGVVSDAGQLEDKTMGIENSTGTLGITPAGRNNVVWNLAASEAWSFSFPTYSYLWSPATFLNNTAISNPLATAVSATTVYNVQVTNNSTGCVGTGTTTVTVSAPLNGIYTVGAAGNYPTLTAAVNAYNSLCIGGPVVFSLIDPLYSAAETFPISINSNIYQSAINTLTIRPASGVNATISGSVANGPLISIKGKYISINGSNNNSATRNLSITNTNTTAPSVILFGSVAAVPVTNSSLKNCTITNGSNSASAILLSDAAIPGNAGYFNTDSVQNNLVQNAYMGIYAIGVNSPGNGNGLSILLNDLTAPGANALYVAGIYVQDVDGATISENQVANFVGTDSYDDKGIWIASGVRNTTVTGNKISNLNYTGTSGYGSYGIYVSTATSNANILVANNMIANISGDGFDYTSASFALDNPCGILLATTQSGIKLYHNSIYLTGNTLNKSNAVSVGIRLYTGSSADIRNNIIVNNLGRTGASTTTGYGTIGILASTNNAQFTNLNYNDYFINPTGSISKYFGQINTTGQTTLPTWRTATGADAASINVSPAFLSATDLHLSPPAANLLLNNTGTPIAGLATDFDNTTRNGLTPDIGADEFLAPNTGSWVGKTSIDWLVNTNWETNVIPDNTTDVYITGGYTFMPTVITTQAVRKLLLSAPGTPPILTINNGTLQVYDTILRSGGTVDGANGTLEMKGSMPQPIPANLFQANNLKNIIISNTDNTTGVTLAGTLDIYRSVTFGASGKKLTTGGFLTFKSTATETAWLGPMTSTNFIVGDASVERYIPLHFKAWQFLSTPITASSPQTVKQAWQEGASLPNQNPVAGYGTMLTSNRVGATVQPTPGFDAFTSPGPSIKVYKTGGGYIGLNRTDTVISNPKGYMVFVRGDRSVITSGAPATVTVMRMKGTLHTPANPPVTINIPTPGFESIGNPYASAIDFRKIVPTGGVQKDFFYMWDPKLTTGPFSPYGLGGFQSFSWNGTAFDVVPGGGSYGGANRNIESGQAFFVNAPFAAGTVPFTEACKVDSSHSVNRLVPAIKPKQLRTNLNVISGNERILLDGTLIQYDRSYADAVDIKDGAKLNNTGENLGLLRNGKTLVVERRSPIQHNDTVFYKLGQLQLQQYEFEFVPNKLNEPGLQAWLEDDFLHTSTPVNLMDTSRISFEVLNNPGSAAEGRFRLVFRQRKHLPGSNDPDKNLSKSQKAIIHVGDKPLVVLEPSIRISPNPVADKMIRLVYNNMIAGNYDVELIGNTGQVLRKQKVKFTAANGTVVFSTGKEIPPGTYSFVINFPDASRRTLQVIIK